MRFLKKVNQLHNISCSSVLEAHTAILRCQCEVARMNMYIACKTEQAACLQSRMFNLISSIDWHIAVVKLSIKYLYDINYWHEYAQFAFSLTWMSTSVWAHSHPVHSNSLHTLIKWMVISLERFLRHMINRKLFNYIVWTTATMCMCERRIACSWIILWTTFFLHTMLHECTFVRALFLHSKFLLLVKRKAIIWITGH